MRVPISRTSAAPKHHERAIQTVFPEARVTFDGELSRGVQYTVEQCSSVCSDDIHALHEAMPGHAVHFVHGSIGDLIVHVVPTKQHARRTWMWAAALSTAALVFLQDVHKELAQGLALAWTDALRRWS